VCKVNAIPVKYFISLTIFGSIADKMAKAKSTTSKSLSLKAKTGT
jgi:hypothetical protein